MRELSRRLDRAFISNAIMLATLCLWFTSPIYCQPNSAVIVVKGHITNIRDVNCGARCTSMQLTDTPEIHATGNTSSIAIGTPYTLTVLSGYNLAVGSVVLSGIYIYQYLYPPATLSTFVAAVEGASYRNMPCSLTGYCFSNLVLGAPPGAFGPGYVPTTVPPVSSLWGQPLWLGGANFSVWDDWGGSGIQFGVGVDSYGPRVEYFGNVESLDYIASPLPAPTNLQATQIGNSGTQIQLTWDYGSDPIDGFYVERKTPTGSWDPPVTTFTQSNTTAPYVFFDTVPVAYATYTYRVRSYDASGSSGSSNEATGYQILKRITDGQNHHNVRIEVTFEPERGKTLTEVAGKLGYDHFNWISMVTGDPTYYGRNTCYQSSPARDFDGNAQFAPFMDPPIGGYKPDLWMDKLPYYYNEVDFWFRNTFQPLDRRYYLFNNDFAGDQRTSSAMRFIDIPGSRCMNGSSDYESFVTSLEGVNTPFGAEGTLPIHKPLAAFVWRTAFNLTTGAAQLDINLEDPTGTGLGEVFNLQPVRVEDFPIAVKHLLIQSGAQGVADTPKVDRDAPTTAAFLSGPQGANGWYTGPVTVTLIATDIDGPSDIAATSYRLDGGAVVSYTTPFTVSDNGTHTIVFGSVDQAINAENPLPSQTFSIVAALPTVQCTGCYFLIGGTRATLAFNVGVVGTASTFTYNYRTATQTVQFASTTTSQIAVNGNTATFSGQGKLNGVAGYNFTVTAKDGGVVRSGLDTISIAITGPSSYSYSTSSAIAGGDIVVKQ